MMSLDIGKLVELMDYLYPILGMLIIATVLLFISWVMDVKKLRRMKRRKREERGRKRREEEEEEKVIS